MSGQSGVGYIKKFDTERFSVKIAAEVKDFDPLKYIAKKEARKAESEVKKAKIILENATATVMAKDKYIEAASKAKEALKAPPPPVDQFPKTRARCVEKKHLSTPVLLRR